MDTRPTYKQTFGFKRLRIYKSSQSQLKDLGSINHLSSNLIVQNTLDGKYQTAV